MVTMTPSQARSTSTSAPSGATTPRSSPCCGTRSRVRSEKVVILAGDREVVLGEVVRVLGAREGSRRVRFRAGVGVIGRLVIGARRGRVPRARRRRRQALGELERRAKAFYDLLERGEKRAGRRHLPRPRAGDLAVVAESLRDQLDRWRDDVMERDGDLEALYREPRWRQTRGPVARRHLPPRVGALSGRAAHDRHEAEEQLLDQAVEGFSQFLLVNEVPEVYAESQYGRGLAFLDLGDWSQGEGGPEAAAEGRTHRRQGEGRARGARATARRQARPPRARPSTRRRPSSRS